jgi:hypothetical protein
MIKVTNHFHVNNSIASLQSSFLGFSAAKKRGLSSMGD